MIRRMSGMIWLILSVDGRPPGETVGKPDAIYIKL